MSHHLQMILMLLVTMGILFFLIKVWFKEDSPKTMQNSTQDEDVDLSSYQQLVELEEEPNFSTPTHENETIQKKSPTDILSMNVIAKPGETFASYDLFQAISTAGLQFGAMNIFHYYQPNRADKKVLFSLASMTEPGEFDLNHMGEFTSPGLCLFMNLQTVDHQDEVFALMLATAEQLADDLQGELYANPRTPWNDDALNLYQKKISEHVYS
jgi:cell division protein ZipA